MQKFKIFDFEWFCMQMEVVRFILVCFCSLGANSFLIEILNAFRVFVHTFDWSWWRKFQQCHILYASLALPVPHTCCWIGVNVKMMFCPICLYEFYEQSGNFFFLFASILACLWVHILLLYLSVVQRSLISRMLYYSIRLSQDIREKHTASNYVNYIKYSIIFSERARQQQRQPQRRLFCRQKSVCVREFMCIHSAV